MQRRSPITAAQAALLSLVVTAMLVGWVSVPGRASLESLVQPLKCRCCDIMVIYGTRIIESRAHIVKKIKTRSYGIAWSEGELPALSDYRGTNEAVSPAGPVPVIAAYGPRTENPPPESPLIKRGPPAVRETAHRSSMDIPDSRRKPKERLSPEPRMPGPKPPHIGVLPPVPPGVWKHGSRERPRVALSFDSGDLGAGRDGCNRLIDHLIADKTPATFFLTGRFAEGYPDIVRRLGSVRHFELGNHSYAHPDLTGRKPGSVADEIMRAQRAIYALTGRQGRLFRPPFGKVDAVVKEVAARHGLYTVLWDVAADDYRREVTSEQVARAVLGGARNGSIVLLHMHGNGSASCEALPAIITGLRGRGFELVTVSSLIAGGGVE